MPLATSSQIRRAYQRVLSRGLVATPRTVAQELGTGYSEASIASGLEHLLREVSHQGDRLTAPHDLASREQSHKFCRTANDQARIRQGEQKIRNLEKTIRQLTLERDACEQKANERHTELEILRQAAITTIATQQSQIKSLTVSCDDLTSERDQLQTRVTEAETIYWELHITRQMVQQLYKHRLMYSATCSDGVTPWSTNWSEYWNTTDTPKIESPEVTLALHQAHQYELKLKDKYDGIEELHWRLIKENASLLKRERLLQRDVKSLTFMYDDEHRRRMRLLREIRRFSNPNYLRDFLPSDEKGRSLHFQQLFKHMMPTNSTGTDNDE